MNKILAICTSPDKGGLELYFVKLINHYHEKTSNIVALCRNESPISKIINSPVINIKKINFINCWLQIFIILKRIKNENINIIHVSWTKDLLLAVLIKIFSKRKIDIIYYRQMKITRNKKDIYHRFIYKNISKVLVITKQLKSDCERYLPVPSNSIIHLKYGIEIPEIPDGNKKQSTFKKYNLSDKDFTIGVFSRIEEQKGQHLVIEALDKIDKDNIQLLIVGHCMDKKYLDRLADMIKTFNLDQKVSFVPFLESPMEVMSFLDLVILPTYEETFGLVVAESMLMGTPVIGSNAGGVPEIIEDRFNGLLFEPKSSKSLKDKIIDMYDSEELRKKVSNNAKIFAMKNYDYQMHFTDLDKILNKL